MLFRSSGLALLCGLATAGLIYGADSFAITSVNLTPGARPPIVNVQTAGSAPAETDKQRYLDRNNWRVFQRANDDAAPVRRSVAQASFGLQVIELTLEPLVGEQGDGRNQLWTVLFLPPPDMAAVPVVQNYAQSGSLSPGGSNNATGGSCDPKSGFFCPVSGSDQPNVLISGSFVAGGNTKPIYAFNEQVSLYTPEQHVFRYGVQTAVAINQSASPPNNRTRFDPDSLSGSFSLYRLTPVKNKFLYGVVSTLNPAGGEFSRSDPSANFIGSFQEKFVLTPVKLSESIYFTLYPVLGMEAGKNFSRPSTISGVAVDLTGFSAITRGVFGADATLAKIRPDYSGNLFSIQGSWRERQLVFDEPDVVTHHGVTRVGLDTKPRNWIEVDFSYSPGSWQYLALTAKYQYGALPPLFNLVDNLATIGISFQAKQSALSFGPPK